ncbi:PREDICTED: DNA primase large subunit-like [Polistes canadensis]|uniref:DNA primase large subunit-like n=1 Tax=Polistes canadensis TaxID=91411 RepID=UPI000718ED7D|nr:PREDICTED: DNA primase large subunit-like [Polistes canadensis]
MATGNEYVCESDRGYNLHDLQLYKSYPIGNYHLSEIKLMCLQRIDVLLLVEKICRETGPKRKARQCKAILLSELDKINYDSFFNIINGPSKLKINEKITSLRIQDNVSHFVLKIICSIKHRRWFIVQETRLFLWRLLTLTDEEIKTFFIINNIKTYSISEQDKIDLQEFIEISNLNKNIRFYKVPFQAVIDLVAHRKVFIRSGMAFVPEKELAGLCFCYFKENLLAGYKTIIPDAKDAEVVEVVEVTEDAEVIKIVDDPEIMNLQLHDISDTINNYLDMRRKHAMQVHHGPSGNQLDSLLSSVYPLCMRLIHENFRKDHHLKHEARLQYILFLKDIGVSLKDAMHLWKEEFTKKISIKKFEKEYGYRLKYLYGENNTQKQYSCHSCDKIMNSDVKTIGCYGCPFKTLTSVALREKLTEYQFEVLDIEDIIILSSSEHYQKACIKYCKATSNNFRNEIFYSPAEYFRYTFNGYNSNDDSS